MNTSFDKETNTKNLTTKNRNILIKRTKNIEEINIIKSQDMLQNSKQVKKYRFYLVFWKLHGRIWQTQLVIGDVI